MNHTEIVVEKQTKKKIQYPPMYKVIFHNDDYTPMEFVVEILKKIFNKSIEESYVLMMKVHNDGSAVVGVYQKEIAETKQILVQENAKRNEYPLKCTVEEEKKDS